MSAWERAARPQCERPGRLGPRGLALAAALCAGIVADPAHAVRNFVAVALDPVPGKVTTSSTAINAVGQVAGFSSGRDGGGTRAFLDTLGHTVDLGTLGGDTSYATAVNNRGWATGSAAVYAPPYTAQATHAFVYADAQMTDIGSLGGDRSTGYGINDDGAVVGNSRLAGTDTSHAFLYAQGSMRDLGTLGGTGSTAFAVNSRGEVTGGAATTGNEATHAFVYRNGAMTDLGTLGGTSSAGLAINDGGQIVGYSDISGDAAAHAILYSGGIMKDLGTLGGAFSDARAINNRGDIVGGSHTAAKQSRAYLFTDGTMHDLNGLVVSGLSGATLLVAVGINDSGQIVADACVGSLCQAYRLDPLPGDKVEAVEYYHADFDHYFVSANPAEIAALDAGRFMGWTRTGQTLAVYRDGPDGTRPVCRFFGAAFGARSSHFYTADPAECAQVKDDAHWLYEGVAFSLGQPDAAGQCAPGTQPVYRLYNNSKDGAPNHRYTTSTTTRAHMVATGWTAEGYGTDAVMLCAPA